MLWLYSFGARISLIVPKNIPAAKKEKMSGGSFLSSQLVLPPNRPENKIIPATTEDRVPQSGPIRLRVSAARTVPAMQMKVVVVFNSRSLSKSL